MSKKAFDKFINKPERGAKKKERIRQEKKKIRAEKNAYFDEQKRLAKERKQGNMPVGKPPATTDSRPKPAGKTLGSRQNADIQKSRTPQREFKKPAPDQKRVQKRTGSPAARPAHQKEKFVNDKTTKNTTGDVPQASQTDEMPLNKFIAWSGVCGRREAAGLIKSGKVSVNGKLVTQPPHRVNQRDDIKVNGKKISIQKNLVYILLNKPKDYITTTDDPEGRKTVMDLIKRATTERVFPVGRLDRNTTGVLLLTNDGELAQRLTHPKYEVKKIYEVRVDKVVTKQQLDTIASGITLEDGFIKPDMVAYADSKDKSIIGIEIHSGRNRIVRRIFEHLGFDVKHLDRVMYGIFTKKNVERGKWRMLSEKEIRMLKHLNTSFKTPKPS